MSQHQLYPGYTGEPGRDDSASLLASATDLLNSWARDISVTEARNESEIKLVIDRLWAECSRRIFGASASRLTAIDTELLDALHVARARMAHFTLEESIQIDAAINRAESMLPASWSCDGCGLISADLNSGACPSCGSGCPQSRAVKA